MHNNSKLSSHGNLGFAQSASLRKSDAPGFERRPLCYTGEQHISRLVEVTSQHLIAAFRDSTCPVGLAGCVSLGRQSHIGSDASRPLEARGVVIRRKKAKSCDWADARRCHEPSHLSIVAGQPQHLAVECRPIASRALSSGGSDPRLLRLTMGGDFDATLGSDPVHKDRPCHGLGLSILDDVTVIPKPIVRTIPRAMRRGGSRRISRSCRSCIPARG